MMDRSGLVGWLGGLVGLPDICVTVEEVDRYDRGGHDLPSQLALDGGCCGQVSCFCTKGLQTSPSWLYWMCDMCWRKADAAVERRSENPLSVGPPARRQFFLQPAMAWIPCRTLSSSLQRLFVGTFLSLHVGGCQRARGLTIVRGAPLGARLSCPPRDS